MWGTIVFTEWDSGCLRRILLDANGVRGEFNPIHSERGEINEDLFAEKLDGAEVSYERESPFREAIPTTVCQLSGRIDFLTDKNGVPYPIELKSTESETQRKNKIQYGKWGLNNVAQLVTYMAIENTKEGKLLYTFFKRDEEGQLYRPKEFTTKRGTTYRTERAYEVTVSDARYIAVDGKQTQFRTDDVLLHHYWAARVIQDDIIWERPANYDAPFGSPCKFCSFKNTCNLYDDGLVSTAKEFIELARQELESYE